MKLLPHSAQLVAVLGEPTAARAFDEAQWSGLIATARSANVLGALAERLSAAGVTASKHAARHLDGAKQLNARQRQSVLWEIHQLQSALGKLQVPVLLLKGAAYVMSQEHIAKGRLFGDIDILVPRAALGDVESQLMLNGWVSAKASAYDQRYYRQWMHEIPPMTHLRRGTVIDVHHSILPMTSRNRPDPMKIVARSVSIPTTGLEALRVPCPEDLVIHSITHLVHEGELHNGLRDLWDIHCMLLGFGEDPEFWTRLIGYAVGNDLAQPVLLGLHLSRMAFATPVPAAALAALSAGEGSTQPAKWLLSAYARALSPENAGRQTLAVAAAKLLIYVRAHSLRMPLHLLLRHLSIKAWTGWRQSFGNQEK